MDYQVKNTDSRTICYSIGAHPGFNIPLEEGESFEDYQLEFEQTENTSSLVYDLETKQFERRKTPAIAFQYQRSSAEILLI